MLGDELEPLREQERSEHKMKKPGLLDGAGEWDESEHPRDGDGKFTNGNYSLPDEQNGSSVGAKWANYDVFLTDGSIAHFAEGTKIYNKEVFAGKGTKTPIRQEDYLITTYGGKKGQWIKVKAIATLEFEGKTFESEIHWYEEPSVGKVGLKEK